uniref:Enhancer of polycomb homolog n=1 Tax=Scleropages formosus TaxID=113540 RepID=A0A8C9TDZ1_SCLFO
MSKLSFRARALDASKPLPVFRCEDLPDLNEYASINRAVPQMPTGMEKEEESEHHLQRAISAQQVYGEKRDNMVIPVPEAESNISYYDSLYPGEFRMPKQLIHIQPFSLDTEQPDYDLDSDDEAFVNKLRKKMEITPLQFEEMIDRLEKGSGQQLVTLQEAKLLLKEDDDLIREVFDYWTRKRKACKSASLIPVVKQEKRDGSSTNDPYVAFRRRTEKMYSMADFGGEVMAEVLAQRALIKPTYTMPLIPLSSNQFRHQDHLELKDFKPKKTEVVRTKRKYEKKPKVLQPSSSVSQQSGHSSLPAFNAKDLNQYDFPSSDEEPFSQMLSGSSEAEEDSDPDGPFAFRRKAGCQYYAPGQGSNWPWCDPGDPRYRYSLTTLTVPHRCVGLARRRVGRGGRFLLDRAHSDLDNVFYGLDPEMHSLPAQSPNGKLASTSESNTSDRPAPPDLGHILLNIKSCRWRHFRPRTLPRDSDSSGLYRGLTRVSMANPRTQTGGSTSQSRTGPGPAPAAALTAEQYQQHQEQLALMQKQQLEQIQQQQAGNAPAALTTQGLVSKTLDSASAQFAASALVTTEELLAIKAKEEIVLGIGVNGVLPGSGVYKGLHLASAAPAALVNTSPPAAVAATTTANTAAPAFHQPSAANSSGMTAQTPSGHGAAAQVLMGNSVRLGMSSAGGTVNSITTLNARHIPRTLTAVPPSALKLAAAATANCQVPKVTAASSLDMVVRENHDQETTALNSIADSTVAMEVT